MKKADLYKAGREVFVETVLGSGRCLIAESRPEHRCEGKLDAHHVLPKQFLKAHFSTLEPDERHERVWDPANGIPLCRRFHDLVTTKARYIYLEELPCRVIDFADDNGIRWRLDRECPSLSAGTSVR